MRVTVTLFAAFLLFGCQTMQSEDTAKQQIAAVTKEWIADMTAHDMARVTALYAPDALLWGTRSPTIRTTPDKVHDYFSVLRNVPSSYKAVLGEQHIRVYGDIAINSGTYTFSEVRDSKEIVRPARFSFVFRHAGERWLIVDHHSSAIPAS